jgi:hypothetical protein
MALRECKTCGFLVPIVDAGCPACAEVERAFPRGLFPNGTAPDLGGLIRRALAALELDEGDRQLVIMSLARESLEHPGFKWALARVARQLGGLEMFEAFRRIGAPAIEPVSTAELW